MRESRDVADGGAHPQGRVVSSTTYGEKGSPGPGWSMAYGGTAFQTRRWGLRFVSTLRGNGAEVSSLRFSSACRRSVDCLSRRRVGVNESSRISSCVTFSRHLMVLVAVDVDAYTVWLFRPWVSFQTFSTSTTVLSRTRVAHEPLRSPSKVW